LHRLKCPHGTGEDTHGAEAVKKVASDEDGRGRKYHQSFSTITLSLILIGGGKLQEKMIYTD
jgi:hypothetical protein